VSSAIEILLTLPIHRVGRREERFASHLGIPILFTALTFDHRSAGSCAGPLRLLLSPPRQIHHRLLIQLERLDTPHDRPSISLYCSLIFGSSRLRLLTIVPRRLASLISNVCKQSSRHKSKPPT